MSAPAATIATPAPALSASLCALLEILGGGGDGGRIVVEARSRGGIGQRQLILLASRNVAWIPAPLLELLEDDAWGLEVKVPVLDDAGSAPVRLGAVVATVRREPVYQAGAWAFDWPGIAEAIERTRALLPPTLVVEARTAAVAVWALAQPLDVRDAEAQARALELHRRLAARVAGDGSADELQDLAVPLPGAVVRNAGDFAGYADCVELDRARMYTVEQIEAALAAARKE